MTIPPTHPDLLALLRGELTNAEVLDAADHLDGCDACRHELALTATGHALVTSSARTLGGPTRSGETARPEPAPALPPLADIAADRRGRIRTRLAQGVAAAAAVAVVAGGGYLVGDRAEPAPIAVPSPSSSATPTPSGTTLSAVLKPVEGSATGTVDMTDDGTSAVMRIETDRLEPVKSGDYYYAWLLDPKTNKMLPLGQVGPGGVASFEVPPDLLASYSAVDVSLETDDGDPGHSPHSVLRAVYA